MDAEFPTPLQCLFIPKRYKILWGGRGAGRSWNVARVLLLEGAKRPIRVLCVRELQNSIAESVHKVLSDQIDLLGLDPFYEVQKAQIIGSNGTTFSFEGIKNNTRKIKSYEGIDYCWVEEAVKVSKASWGILIPTIRKESSEIWMTFNPELESDYTYTRWVKNKALLPAVNDRFPVIPETPIFESNPGQFAGSFVVKMTYRDNPWFPQVLRDEMDTDRLDPDHYLNIWEGHCLQMLEGTVYAKELRKAEETGRIGSVPWEKTVPVDTFWDLGRANNTAIWFAQRVALQWRVISYYEESLEDIQHFIKVLQDKGYTYGLHHLPHDAKAKTLGTKRSIEENIRAAFPEKTRIVPKLSVEDGINAGRMIFNQLWFDESECVDGLHALRHYRYKVIDGQLSDKPLHDWASDGADAFRYMAVSLRAGVREGGILGVVKGLTRAAKEWRRGREDLSSTGQEWMR